MRRHTAPTPEALRKGKPDGNTDSFITPNCFGLFIWNRKIITLADRIWVRCVKTENIHTDLSRKYLEHTANCSAQMSKTQTLEKRYFLPFKAALVDTF